jgi:hypothetical protein
MEWRLKEQSKGSRQQMFSSWERQTRMIDQPLANLGGRERD